MKIKNEQRILRRDAIFQTVEKLKKMKVEITPEEVSRILREAGIYN